MRRLIGLVLLTIAITPIACAGHALEIFQIEAKDCGYPGTKIQTGFYSGKNNGVVTALHGVAGCRDIVASLFSDQDFVEAYSELAITQADIRRDIAVLSHDNLRSLKPHGTGPAVPGSKLVSSGFPQAVGRPLTKNLTAGSVKSLRFMLPPDDLDRYRAVGSPDLAVDVLSLDGNVQVGFSGAPLLDTNGNVVAVLIGGFGHGEFGTSWAVPIADIDLDIVSEENIARIAKLRHQFGFSFSEAVSEETATVDRFLSNLDLLSTTSEYLIENLGTPFVRDGTAASQKGFISGAAFLGLIAEEEQSDFIEGIEFGRIEYSKYYIDYEAIDGLLFSVSFSINLDDVPNIKSEFGNSGFGFFPEQFVLGETTVSELAVFGEYSCFIDEEIEMYTKPSGPLYLAVRCRGNLHNPGVIFWIEYYQEFLDLGTYEALHCKLGLYRQLSEVLSEDEITPDWRIKISDDCYAKLRHLINPALSIGTESLFDSVRQLGERVHSDIVSDIAGLAVTGWTAYSEYH